MSFKVIVLNGPKESGKDVIADYLVNKYNNTEHYVFKMMFKEKLVEAAVLTAGVSRADWDRHYERDLKEEPWDKLVVSGVAVSPRQYLIHMSEDVFKKIIGDDVFGKAAANSMLEISKDKQKVTFIFSDSGFESELWPVKTQANNCFLARIHREGKTFEGDSRDYIDPVWIDVDKKKDFCNDRTIEDISEEIWRWAQS